MLLSFAEGQELLCQRLDPLKEERELWAMGQQGA